MVVLIGTRYGVCPFPAAHLLARSRWLGLSTTITPVSEREADELAAASVLHRWDVPGSGANGYARIVIRAGHRTTIVGANGAGKSALGLWMGQHHHGSVSGVRRLTAHRKLWFKSAAPGLVPGQRQQTLSSLSSWSVQRDSRYLDHGNGVQVDVVLLDLLNRVSYENAQMAAMYRSGTPHQEADAKFGPPLLDLLSAIFQTAGLPLEFRVTEEQALNAVNTASKSEYPIFQMSDGEKSALLLAAEVLTIPEGSICIIDEPERHLHRAISARLVEAIIADRLDCHFVILTHDLELAGALGGGTGQLYSLTGCTWSGLDVIGWELFPVDASAEIPESARLAILGGRRKLLFIEGDKHSLDLRLYGLLFPDWTLSSLGGCDQVMRAVGGLRESRSHHWVHARGVVDGDGRTEEEKSSLHAQGILALPVNEVESLYYSAVVLKAVATGQADAMGESVDALLQAARTVALQALREPGVIERLAKDLALKVVRRRLLEELPANVDTMAASITVAVSSPYPGIRSELDVLLAAGDLDGAVRLAPIRTTKLRDQVARALHFRSHGDYETAARVRISKDATLASEVRALIGPLPS